MVKEEKLKRSDVDLSFISKDKRFDNLTGRFFGDLKILGPYRKEGRTLKWVAECSCGNVVKTSATKVKQRGKTCCVDCSEIKLRQKHFTPMDMKVQNLLNKRKDLKIISWEGETWADEWNVCCKICEESYSKRYRDLMNGVKGCKCSKYKRKKLDEKITVVLEYCDKYGFEFIGWDTDNRIKVDLYCPRHNNKLKPHYGNIEKDKVCCKDCCKELYKPYNLGTRESFIEKVKQVHGEDAFDYSLVEYVNSDTHVRIKCNNCGEINNQTPSGHLSGRQCKSCSKTGYKPNEPCWIYIMKLQGLCEEWYKIGITKDLKRRLYNVRLESWYDIDYLDFKLLDNGWKAKRIESLILKQLKTKGIIDRKYHKEGCSEIFKPVELPLVEELLEEYYLEEKYLQQCRGV